MATTSFFPIGTQLQRKNDSAVFEKIPQCSVLNTPQVTTDYDDVTNHDSVGGYKEFEALLKDPGEISCELIFNPAEALHKALYTDNEAGTKRSWKLILPDGASTTFSFDAFVSGLSMPLDTTRSARLAFTLRVSGAPALS